LVYFLFIFLSQKENKLNRRNKYKDLGASELTQEKPKRGYIVINQSYLVEPL